ncbi:MAG: SDR family NAD(P)-dependent oxidoreductase [Vampirovibrionales bacterium]
MMMMSSTEQTNKHAHVIPTQCLLEGKVAIITGGSRGIGKGLCEVFAREGATVIFLYASNDEAANDTLAKIEALGGQGKAYKLSVTDKDGIKAMIKEVIDTYGQIDILVNNAAINKGDNFVTTTEKSWLHIMDTNVNGLYYMTKPIIKQMMKQRRGNVLNITSIAALRAVPTSVHYATSKAAVVGFTKCLAREVSSFGITVNAIAAGIYDTDLGHDLPDMMLGFYENWVPKGRLGVPQDLAEMACFMCSDRNTYMAGEVITVDGGATV